MMTPIQTAAFVSAAPHSFFIPTSRPHQVMPPLHLPAVHRETRLTRLLALDPEKEPLSHPSPTFLDRLSNILPLFQKKPPPANHDQEVSFCDSEAIDDLPNTDEEKQLAGWFKELQQLPTPERQKRFADFSVEEIESFHQKSDSWDKITKQLTHEYPWETFNTFNLDQDSYHQKALGIALIAKTAYMCIDTQRNMASCYPAWCDTLLKSGFQVKSFGFEQDCSRGLAFYRGKEVIVAFRGSSKISDVLLDIDACHTPGYGGHTHRGLKLALDKVRDQLFTTLEEIREEVKEPLQLVLTGHSMGGACAYFTACELAGQKNYEVNRVITFGAPKVFDKNAAQFYRALGLHEKTIRFRNFSDIVTYLPPTPPQIYQHVGQEYYISKNHEIWVNPPNYQMHLDQLQRFNSKEQEALGFELRTIGDHSLHSYIKGLYLQKPTDHTDHTET